MGVVYKARDTHLDRTVAIKVLPHEKVSDPERKQRFVQEAKAASALNHPNIVTVHDIRSDAGVDFIVMEYAGERTLDQIIPAKGLGITQSLRFGAQIADALARAHEAGIVHRDVKPSNIIVTDDHRVKVLDFGLAKLFEPSARAAEARTQTTPLTDAGMVVGTAAYMSPEQAEGREVDARSDIFSFGTVLYEMVTGRRPFVGDSNLSVMAKILNEDPAPPSSVVAVGLVGCRANDPALPAQGSGAPISNDGGFEGRARRPRGGLRCWTAGPDAGRARRLDGWRWAWAALVPVRADRRVRRLAAWQSPEAMTPLRAVPLTSLSGVTRSPSFSPDGNQVAFAWTGLDGNNPDIYVQQIGAEHTVAAHHQPGQRLQPDVVARRPLDRVSPRRRRGPSARTAARAAAHRARTQADRDPAAGVSARRDTGLVPGLELCGRHRFEWGGEARCPVRGLAGVGGETAGDDPGPGVCGQRSSDLSRRQVAGLPSRGRAVHRGAHPAAPGEGFDRGWRTASSHNHTTSQRTTPGGRPTAPRFCSLRRRRSGDSVSPANGTPERLPFVGDDGVAPVVSSPRAGGPARLAYVRSYTDANIWRIETSISRRARLLSTGASRSPRPDGTPSHISLPTGAR